MRELKFRAWDSEGHEMSDPMTMRQLLTYSPLDEESADNLDNLMVMQFTGLQDANGVEIYEGDIVNIAQNGWATDEYRGVVVEYCGVRGYSPWDECSGQIDIDYLASAHSEDIEVIGNIHQNPELVNT